MALLNFQAEQHQSGFRSDADRAREKVFLEHYRWLQSCAMQYTHGQRERAEDLVHDVFLQFQIKQVEVEAIDDLRGYLRGILRNLYLLQLRRAARYPVQQLSLLDHDSAEMGLRAQSALDHFQTADLLVRACNFVCHRKETSVPASILILRFFHGYYTDEICRATGAQRRLVNKWLTQGRNETKTYLESPYPLPEREAGFKAARPNTPRAFLAYLRRLIFDSCTTPCSILEDEPGQGAGHNSVQALAHLVSCPTCLERRSCGLGLPSVTDRMMDDISGRSDGTNDGKGKSRGTFLDFDRRAPRKKRLRQVWGDRLREIFEHHPSELSIAFDGETHAALLLNAPLNTLNLSLEQRQCPDSIGILSEQEVCLLILDRAEIESRERKVYTLPLSEGRLLEVVITPEFRGPSIQIAYRNPGYLPMWASTWNDSPADAEPGLLLVPEREPGRISDAPVRNLWERMVRALPRFERPAMNPTLATALLLAVSSVVLLVLGLQQRRTAVAADILKRASAAELLLRTDVSPGVIYQHLTIHAPGGTFERTIYRDAQRRRQPKQLDGRGVDPLRRKLAGAGVDWELPLSPVSYKEWHDRLSSERDAVTLRGKNLIVLTTTVTGDSSVARESLTLRESDLHAVDRTIEFRDMGTVEIAEVDYGVLPWGPETEKFFEPLADMSPQLPSSLRPSLHLPRPLSEAEFDEAELEAQLALHRLGADTSERIDIVRGGNSVQVKGIVATADRKREIETRLRQVPNVVSAIYTFEELDNRQRSSEAITSLKQSSVVETPSPLETYLLAKQEGREEIRQLGLKLSNASVSARRECNAITELLARFSTQKILTANARSAADALLADHKAKLLTALEEEERLLAEAGFSSASMSANLGATKLAATASLSAMANRNSSLCVELLSGSPEPSRAATAIVPELEASIAELRATAMRAPNSVTASQTSPTPLSALPNEP